MSAGPLTIDNLSTEVSKFKDLTHQLNNYNEIYNLNIYLQNNGNKEKDRLMSTNETLKSKIMRLRQEYILMDRKKAFMAFKNNLVYYSIVIIALMLLIVGFYLNQAITLNIAVAAVIVIAVFFILSVVLVVKVNSDRKVLLWDHYYFGPMENK